MAATAVRLGEKSVHPHVVTGEFCADCAVTDDQHAVADRSYFLEVAGAEQRRRPVRGRRAKKVVQLGARSDIDASGWIDQND